MRRDEVLALFASEGLRVEQLELGKLTRCASEGDSGKKQSGWYVLHEIRLDSGEYTLVGNYGNWKDGDGDKREIGIGEGEKLTQAQREEIANRQRRAAEAARRDKKKRNDECAERAADTFPKLPDSGACDYLTRKKVAAFGLGFSRGSIAIPLRGVDGKLRSLQWVDAGGNKKFMTGTEKVGSFHALAELVDGAAIGVAEGYATAATVQMATNGKIPMVCCFDAGNLSPVVKELRAAFADSKIYIFGDDDHQHASNPGVTKGRQAALETKAVRLILPAFPERFFPAAEGAEPKPMTDWNDVHCVSGLVEVRRQINEAVNTGAERAGHCGEPDDAYHDEDYAPEQEFDEADFDAGQPAVVNWGEDVSVDDETGMPWPEIHGRFQVDTEGVFQLAGDNRHRLSGRPLWLDSVTTGLTLPNHGVVIKFFDHHWRLHTLALPAELLHEQGGAVAKLLARRGMIVIPGKEKMLSQFIRAQEADCDRFTYNATKLGWAKLNDGRTAFVLPETVIGATDADVVYQGDIPMSFSQGLRMSCSLSEWHENVAAKCDGNPLLMFAVLTALAGPLLELMDQESGGFHFFGTTSRGKTTTLQAGISVWGNGASPSNDATSAIRSWDVTSSSLESIAELHSHMVLPLDEIGNSEIYDLGKVVYKLSSGVSKQRADITAALRDPRTWTVMILSSGELSMKRVASMNGGQRAGGQMVRILDVPISPDGDESGGVVVDSKGEDRALFVERLKLSCAEHYGVAGPTFAAYLISQLSEKGRPEFVGVLREYQDQFQQVLVEMLGEQDLPPESARALRRFSLVAVAGWLALPSSVTNFPSAGVLPWRFDSVMGCIADVARRWLSELGGSRSEADRALEHFRDRLISEYLRFIPVFADKPAPNTRPLGVRFKSHIGIYSGEISDLVGDFELKTVMHALRDRGLLDVEKGRLTRKSMSAISWMDHARPRLYHVSLDFLGDKVAQGELLGEEGGSQPFV